MWSLEIYLDEYEDMCWIEKVEGRSNRFQMKIEGSTER